MPNNNKVFSKLGFLLSAFPSLRVSTFSIRSVSAFPNYLSCVLTDTQRYHKCPNIQKHPHYSSATSLSQHTQFRQYPKYHTTIQQMSSTSHKNEEDVNTEGIIMILSPAKTLDVSSYEPNDYPSFPKPTEPNCNYGQTKQVARFMKQQKKKSLEKLLSISAKLADSAYQYWQDFTVDDAPSSSTSFSKPAIFSFSGAAYQGLNAPQFLETSSDPISVKALSYLQSNLHIIDATYGVLKPMDQMQPTRLEMATKGLQLDNGSDQSSDKKKGTNLSEFWKPSVTNYLQKEIQSRPNPKNPIIVLNLASDEYSSAVHVPDLLEIEVKYIKAVFQQEGRVIAVHAKRARGLMVRYLATNQISIMEGIQQFNEEGYSYIPSRSTDEILVFDRKKPPPKAKSPPKKKKKNDDNEDGEGNQSSKRVRKKK